jgi:membrane-bound serine protease (ClpP class)
MGLAVKFKPMKNTFLIWLVFLTASAFSQNKTIYKITIDGVINPVATEYILESIEKAEEANVQLLIIEMDTPGGLMVSMHDIVKGILGADVPVAVYVSPSGSRAGSAGVFITIAAHIAAMAPGTNIGSAHPVQMGGGGAKDTTQVMTYCRNGSRNKYWFSTSSSDGGRRREGYNSGNGRKNYK